MSYGSTKSDERSGSGASASTDRLIGAPHSGPGYVGDRAQIARFWGSERLTRGASERLFPWSARGRDSDEVAHWLRVRGLGLLTPNRRWPVQFAGACFGPGSPRSPGAADVRPVRDVLRGGPCAYLCACALIRALRGLSSPPGPFGGPAGLTGERAAWGGRYVPGVGGRIS
jgi:hypothetical protein